MTGSCNNKIPIKAQIICAFNQEVPRLYALKPVSLPVSLEHFECSFNGSYVSMYCYQKTVLLVRLMELCLS